MPKPKTTEWEKDIEEKLKLSMVELIDEWFPKGDKRRGRAIMIMALFLGEALSLMAQREDEVRSDLLDKMLQYCGKTENEGGRWLVEEFQGLERLERTKNDQT